MVALELTVEEAEAALTIVKPHTFLDREALHSFEAKLRQAIMVERGAGGSHEDAEALAKHLLGKDVRVTTNGGDEHVGHLGRLSGWHTIVLEQANGRLPINLSHIAAIERLEDVA